MATETYFSMEALEDGVWYRGEGRNSHIGLWDRQSSAFWVIALNDFPNPKRFPEAPTRQVRMKQEKHWDVDGSFKPVERV